MLIYKITVLILLIALVIGGLYLVSRNYSRYIGSVTDKERRYQYNLVINPVGLTITLFADHKYSATDIDSLLRHSADITDDRKAYVIGDTIIYKSQIQSIEFNRIDRGKTNANES